MIIALMIYSSLTSGSFEMQRRFSVFLYFVVSTVSDVATVCVSGSYANAFTVCGCCCLVSLMHDEPLNISSLFL